MAFAKLLVQASSMGRGVSLEIIDEMLEEYREELSQDRYNLGYVSAAEHRRQQRVQEVMELNQRMARLDAMTVTDEEIKESINDRPR